jgi:hypothetical protein
MLSCPSSLETSSSGMPFLYHLLALYGRPSVPDLYNPFFMNRFRKVGFINYDTGDTLHVRSALLYVVLHDDDGEFTAWAARFPTAP